MTSAKIWRPVAAVLAACMLTACDKPAETAAPLPPVRVTGAKTLDASAGTAVVATGLVRLREEVPLAFKIGGIIQAMRVDAGQQVAAGQLLASLDPAEIDAQVLTARENLQRAERDLERAHTLFARGMVAQRAEQDARTARDQAKAALDAATFNRQHAQIHASAAGVVLQKRAETRETVAAGQPVLVLGRLDRGWVVKSGLAAKDAVRLAVGGAADVALDATGTHYEGQISRIGAASDARTGTVEVEVTLPGAKALVSGMVARLDFKLQSSPHGANKATDDTVARTAPLVLPLSAVLEGDGGRARVFVLEGDKVRRIEVRTGALHDGSIEVVDGLAPGAQVVVEGAAWLDDGAAVRVLK